MAPQNFTAPTLPFPDLRNREETIQGLKSWVLVPINGGFPETRPENRYDRPEAEMGRPAGKPASWLRTC